MPLQKPKEMAIRGEHPRRLGTEESKKDKGGKDKGLMVFICMHVGAHVHMSAGAQGGQKRVSDPPELALRAVASRLMLGPGNQAWILGKGSW